jgi:hypothetical protein
MQYKIHRIHEVLYRRKHGKRNCFIFCGMIIEISKVYHCWSLYANRSKLQSISFNMLMENLLPQSKGGTIL